MVTWLFLGVIKLKDVIALATSDSDFGHVPADKAKAEAQGVVPVPSDHHADRSNT